MSKVPAAEIAGAAIASAVAARIVGEGITFSLMPKPTPACDTASGWL